MPPTAPSGSLLRRVVTLGMVAVVFVVLVGCRVAVTVDTKVNEDGSGTVDVGLGLDDAALARSGNLDRTVVVDDLRATGWVVAPAKEEADGLTWLRASKPFATLEEGTRILGDLTGPTGAFRDFAITKEDGLGRTTWRLTGTLDLSRGLDTFADPELATALGGDPFGGWIPAIEEAEGRPARDMVDVTVMFALPAGDPKTFTPKLGDPVPTSVDVDAQKTFVLPLPLGGSATGVGGWILLGGVVIVGAGSLGFLRRRFRAVGR